MHFIGSGCWFLCRPHTVAWTVAHVAASRVARSRIAHSSPEPRLGDSRVASPWSSASLSAPPSHSHLSQPTIKIIKNSNDRYTVFN